jgi:hypothetical protein
MILTDQSISQPSGALIQALPLFPHKASRPVAQYKARESIARIARGFHHGAENTCKPPHFYTVDKRAVFVRTVDNLLSAGDNQQQHRPRESPANRRINEGAGDAVGTLLDVTPGDHTSNRSRSSDFDHCSFKPS